MNWKSSSCISGTRSKPFAEMRARWPMLSEIPALSEVHKDELLKRSRDHTRRITAIIDAGIKAGELQADNSAMGQQCDPRRRDLGAEMVQAERLQQGRGSCGRICQITDDRPEGLIAIRKCRGINGYDGESIRRGRWAGLRVLGIGPAHCRGRFCAQLFGDMGADVIKVEPPGRAIRCGPGGGRAIRFCGPFARGTSAASRRTCGRKKARTLSASWSARQTSSSRISVRGRWKSGGSGMKTSRRKTPVSS